MLPAKKPNTGEFLGGFWKEDRLIPSVTLTVYFGCEEWDGLFSLFDMMDVRDQKVLSCMDNYHVRLIAPALMTDSEIMKFQTSLREVMLFIKYSKDKKALKEMLDRNRERFQCMERRAVDVCKEIQMFGFPGTYKLPSYPNLSLKKRSISTFCFSESLDLIYSI